MGMKAKGLLLESDNYSLNQSNDRNAKILTEITDIEAFADDIIDITVEEVFGNIMLEEFEVVVEYEAP